MKHCFFTTRAIKMAVLPVLMCLGTLGLSAQLPSQKADSIWQSRQRVHTDTATIIGTESFSLPINSLKPEAQMPHTVPTNETQATDKPPTTPADSLAPAPPVDSAAIAKALRPAFVPNSKMATWMAIVFPGAGQIYNRKYWKLPIIYGGFFGCAYALGWNSKMYADYSQAYLDIMDDNPATKSYENLLPPNAKYSEDQLKQTLKRRKDFFRRNRDISIFAFIAVYALSVVDAYVDAELSDFDIGPDISMRLTTLPPAATPMSGHSPAGGAALQCVWHF